MILKKQYKHKLPVKKYQGNQCDVKSLTTIEEIENYNYKIGYPDKLYF